MHTSYSLTRGLTLISATTLTLFSSADATSWNFTSNTTLGLLSSGNVALDAKWTAAYEKAKTFVSGLTNEEKITLITGSDVATANWTALNSKDGSQGIISYYDASGFSEASSIAQTWDKDMLYAQAAALSAEMYGKGFQWVNGPTSQPLGRTPWCGRLVETFAQDTYMNSIAFGLGVAAYVETGVIAGGKHFLLNEQETNRKTQGSTLAYSAVADDKTLHETYLFPFYDAVKAGMGAVMCAMNRVNGSQSCENSDLLNKFLKTELGFPGLVYPDQGGQTTAYGSFNGGEDFGSSSYWSNETILAGIGNGTLTQDRLDDMTIRNVIGYYYVGLDNGAQPSISSSTAYDRDVRGNHSQMIRSNGAASLSLLKNTNNALPLKAPRSIAIFGSNAGPVMGGPGVGFSVAGSGPTYQGHLAGGTGSGTATFPYLVTPHDALLQRVIQDGTMYRWIMNDTQTATSSGSSNKLSLVGGTGFGTGTNVGVNFDNYSENMDVCIVFINALSGEGADRTELRNDDQDTLVETIASNCNNTMVVVNTVGARILDAWIENENVTAVVYGGLLGQNSGFSIVDVLYGDVNPSGRLIHTIAKNESDYTVTICETETCDFTEGNYIDYKYFDKYNITPRYEFGYGLSYTTFNYSDISAVQTAAINTTYATGTLAVGGREDLWTNIANITATISNTGVLDGHEVTQLYVAFPDAADQPLRSLRGFERILIATGSSKTVSFPLRRRDLSYWDVVAQEWAVADGTYTFYVGASSRDLRLKTTLNITV